jgi:hypothetical protein
METDNPYGFVISQGLARVKSIIAVKVPKGGSVSAPSVSGNGNAPLSPKLGNTVTSLDRDTINNLGNQAIKTYVFEQDVTNSQEKITQINRAARIG